MEIQLKNRLEEKRNEIKSYIISEFQNVDGADEFAEILVDNFCKLTVPVQTMEFDEKFTYTTFKHNDGLDGAVSIKSGNIFLSWKRLLFDSFEHTTTLVGAVTTSVLAPVIIPFAALIVWNKMWGLRQIKISERHAMVLSALWNIKHPETDIVAKDEVIEKINIALSKYDRPDINLEEFSFIVSELDSLKVVELNPDGGIWLRDWVKLPYN